MLDKFKELIFGFGEFEKTKFEVRYDMLGVMLPTLNIRELKDFEILEECISKVKEQLRVKSSNLNKTIADPSKKLLKKDVVAMLEKMNKIKYDFLEKAFNIIRDYEPSFIEHSGDSTQVNVKKGENVNSESVVYENDLMKVVLENGKVPYLLVDFRKDVDFMFLKRLASLFFEEYKIQGTNILIEGNRVLIIARFVDDKLFEMPRVEVNLDEVYDKIKKVSDGFVDTEKSSEDDEIKDAEYVELNKKPMEFKSKKNEEDSLDALLMKSGDNDFTPKPNPVKDESTMIFEKDESIQIEEKEVVKEPEIEIVRKDEKIEGSKIEKEDGNLAEKEKVKDELKEVKVYENEVYRDDKIVAYLKSDSKVLGELVVELISKDVSESDFSYLMIFSKIFSSILFEVAGSAGTNLILDFSNCKMRIVPRVQNDNLGLNWKLKEESEEFLNQIRDRLILEMQNVGQGQEKKEVVKEEERVKEVLETESDSEEEKMRKKKVNHLLEHLRKIP